MQRFADRIDAGRKLAAKLTHLAAAKPIVLGLPRGGVPVAAEVARALKAPLDVLLVRKIGAPGQPELAAGAVAEGEPPVIIGNDEIMAALGLDRAWLEQAAQKQVGEIARRQLLYRQGRKPPDLAGRTVILVDDGIATGATIGAALRAARHLGAAHIVLAVPVAPPSVIASLRGMADEIVVLLLPEDFGAVGFFYADFSQTEDGEVVALLAGAARG